ncbi:MAG: AAA family ATPase, partial [Myxococcota bacterium]|nr:AAA family ATPase [Myxococcota bacterium]
MTPSTRPISPSLEIVAGLEDDPEATRIVNEEMKLLSTVLRALEASTGADLSAARGRATDETRLLELRDDVAVAKPEDLPSLFEQMHHLGALRAQRGRSIGGSIDRTNPYFGHLRLEEAVPPNERRPGTPSKRRRDVLIGSRSYVDSEAGIRIVDWRHAPVSRIYYRYAEGDDYEEELGSRMVEGVVAARRGVTIVAGQLVRVTATQGTFVRGADDRWKRVAARRARLETEKKWDARHDARLGIGVDGELRRNKDLPAIAALLDPRQFDLIAQDGVGLVAVQGSAGSGKTTVGMHRVAYLAFKEPQRFRPDNMLVIVPNEALVHYVARVLPSLGVEGVPVSTFSRFATRLMSHMFPKMPTAISEETPSVVSKAKAHPAILRGIDRRVALIDSEVDARIRASMAKWPQSDGVALAWEATQNSEGSRTPPDLRLTMLTHWVAGKRQLSGVGEASTLPQVTRSALEQIVARERAVTRSVSGVWDELLTSRESLADTFSGEPGFGSGQLDQVHNWCLRQARVRSDGERDGESPTLDAEDRALLFRCWQVLRGPIIDSSAKPIRFAHLFVDEVQDASAVELRVLVDLTGKDRCITLAGDVAQRM